jgi:prepilin peptidase CpaA
VIAYLLLSVFPAGLLIAAAHDIYEFKIPNWISIVLVLSYPAAGLAVGASAGIIVDGLLIAAATLAVGFALFTVKFFGGGDAKLFAATAPWIGVAGLGIFLFYTAMAGFVLAIWLMMFRKTPPLPIYAQAPWILRLHQRKHDLPYGVAIAVGGLVSFPQTPFFQLVFGG